MSYLQLVPIGFRKGIAVMGINRQQWDNTIKCEIGESLGEGLREFFVQF